VYGEELDETIGVGVTRPVFVVIRKELIARITIHTALSQKPLFKLFLLP
jgi:hypothetical protein